MKASNEYFLFYITENNKKMFLKLILFKQLIFLKMLLTLPKQNNLIPYVWQDVFAMFQPKLTVTTYIIIVTVSCAEFAVQCILNWFLGNNTNYY